MNSTLAPIEHRANWTAETLQAQSAAWVYTLTEDDIAELDRALQQVRQKGLVVPQLGKTDFPLPQLMRKLAPFVRELESGLGLLQIRGLPVARYSKDQCSAMFWGIGMHLGKPWSQNQRGHVLGDVIDEGKTMDDPTTRGYQTTTRLNMHTDGADLVGLLFLKQATQGGESQITSAIAVFNQLAQTQPALAEHLLKTQWYIDWRGEESPGQLPYYRGSIFTPIARGMTCFALTLYIQSAQRHTDVPRLSALDLAALEAFSAATEDPALLVSFKQEAGDMFFLNNHFHTHGRSSYTDAGGPEDRRHLRRLWLESAAWSGIRPPVMQTILDNARSSWDKPHSTVQMWD